MGIEYDSMDDSMNEMFLYMKSVVNSNPVGDITEQQIGSLLVRVESIVDQVDFELRGATHFRHVYADMAKAHVEQLIEKLRS